MATKEKVEKINAHDPDNFDHGETITVSNGRQTLTTTRKAFQSVYANKGFTESEGDDDYSPDETILDRSSRGRLAPGNDDQLSPQQKAARTKAAKAAKAAGESGSDSEK